MLRFGVALATLCFAANVTCASAQEKLIYIGGRLDGPGDTIFAARFNEKTGALTSVGAVGTIVRPTWLLKNPKLPVLYSVSEVGNAGDAVASVYSLKMDKASGKLTEMNKISSGGGGATHLLLDQPSQTLFVANFGTGHVGAAPVNKDGSLGELASTVKNEGSGPHPRQKGPHAHQTTVDPSGQYALVSDLGADKIFIYKFDRKTRKLAPAETPALAFPPGSGPRHTVFHPNGRLVFLSAELSSEVWTLKWDAKKGTLTPVGKPVSTLPAGFTGPKSGGAILLSKDGRYLYASTRFGENEILAYSVDAETGALTEIQKISSGGKAPWDVQFSPSQTWVLVANEGTGEVVVFKRDPKTGKLSATDSKLASPHPSRVLFVD